MNGNDYETNVKNNIKRFIGEGEYTKAIFYSMQLPINAAHRELKIIQAAVESNQQYKHLSNTIDRIRESSLNYEHIRLAKELVHEHKYPQAAFHCLQLPIEAVGKVSERLGLTHIINEVLKKEEK